LTIEEVAPPTLDKTDALPLLTLANDVGSTGITSLVSDVP